MQTGAEARDTTGDAAGAAALQRLFEAEEAGLAVLDTNGRIAATNGALLRLIAADAAPAPGSAPEDLFDLDSRDAIRGLVAAALAGPPAPPPLEARLARPAQSDPDAAVEVQCRPLRGEPGALLRLQDATARRRLAAQLAEAARLQAVGRLAGGVAHDFNNLLTAIMGCAEGALARGADAQTQADLRQILDSAERGARLVRQLLAFARQQALQPRVLALNEAMAGLSPLLGRLLGGAVRIELALAETSPRIRVDPGQLDQVVLNLAVNARDAMGHRGTLRLSTCEIVVEEPQVFPTGTIPPGRWAILEVADTGAGIPPDILPRVFEPFFTTRQDRGGTGLGLSTVHGIVRQSGGHVTVASRLGEGTVFRLWFPQVEAPTETEQVHHRRAAPAALRPRRTVLLVEDETPIRRLAEHALAKAGFAVQTAETAVEALEALPPGVSPPDAVVTDVSMPGMDGVELAGRLRERFPGLPVLLVSGYAPAALDTDLRSKGPRFLSKPYRLADLVEAVLETLSESESRRG